MNVIDRTEFRDEEGIITLENRIKGTLQHGLDWYGRMQAQVEMTEKLDKSLDKDHTLLRNVAIPGTSVIVPMILMSPQGVRVIEPSPAKGIFRAKGEEWQKFDGRSRRFRRTRPNLQIQALQNAELVHRYLQNYLEDQGYKLPEVEAVLLFTNPRTHVDTARSRVRIVLADAIDHFAAKLLEFQPIMDQEDIKILTEALIDPRLPEPEPEPETVTQLEPELAPTVSEFVEEPEYFTAEQKPMALPSQAAYTLSTLPFSRNQWVLLGVIAFFEIVVLIIFALVIITNTFYS